MKTLLQIIFLITVFIFPVIANSASIKPGTAMYKEIGTDVQVMVSLNLDVSDLGRPIGFSLIELDIFWDDPLGNFLRAFNLGDEGVVKMDGVIMVIGHKLLYSNASNAFTGFGNDFQLGIINFQGNTPDDLDFSPLDFPGFDIGRDVETLVPSVVPVPPAVWLFGSGLIGLIGMRKKSKFPVISTQ